MPEKTLRPWKTLRRETLLQLNQFLTVEKHTVELPNGQIIPDWGWVIIPDAAIILAQDNQGRFLCFRQTKYAIEGPTLAPVAGMLEPGEDPLLAAQRELREETGCEASQWIPLGSFCLDPNRGVNTIHCYLALGAHPVAAPSAGDLEDQQLLTLDLPELRQALLSGQFKAIMFAACVSLALPHLEGALHLQSALHLALASLAHRWIEAGWQKGDPALLAALYAPDFIDHDPAGRTPDRAGSIAGVRDLYAAFPDFFAIIEDLIPDPASGLVAIRWSATGAHQGAFLGLPPTGRRIHFKGLEIIRIRAGQITERWGEWDALDLLEQLQPPR
ncbi:MAG: ester cyclase [Anaerolineales bacterium]|nr:ester cyclase [Anaerolineales bacterium]